MSVKVISLYIVGDLLLSAFFFLFFFFRKQQTLLFVRKKKKKKKGEVPPNLLLLHPSCLQVSIPSCCIIPESSEEEEVQLFPCQPPIPNALYTPNLRCFSHITKDLVSTSILYIIMQCPQSQENQSGLVINGGC